LELKRSSGRIIFLNTYPEYALEILCQAFGLKMTTPEYAWVTHAWFYEDFWSTRYFENRSSYQPVNNCSEEDMMRMAREMFVIDHYPMLDEEDNQVFIGNLTIDSFHQLYEVKRNASFGEGRPDLAVQARVTYDATWLAALALDKVERQLLAMSPPLSLQDFDYLNANGILIKDLFYRAALNTTFHGASGLFKLLPDGDREPELRYYQYRPGNGTLKRVYIGMVNETTGKLEVLDDKKPLFTDGMPVSYIRQQLSLPLFIIYAILSVAGIAFAVVCLLFNVVFRKKKLVKLSSPNLNIIFISGIILMYIFVILLGIEDEFVDARGVNALCQLGIWVSVIGFTLAYGSMVAKSFRVYYIFKNLKVLNKDRKSRTIQDWHMFLLIGVAMMVDVVFLVVVTTVPSARLRLHQLELPLRRGEIPREIEICSSESSSIWLPILIGYKAGEVILSLFLVFENRRIKIRELIDNRVILFSVYTIVVACVLLTPIVVLLYNNVDGQYGVLGGTILLIVTVLLCINFLPKMYALKKNPSGEVEIDFSSVVANMSQSSLSGDKLSSTSYVDMELCVRRNRVCYVLACVRVCVYMCMHWVCIYVRVCCVRMYMCVYSLCVKIHSISLLDYEVYNFCVSILTNCHFCNTCSSFLARRKILKKLNSNGPVLQSSLLTNSVQI
jgi:gamma-aminobutyric acid type B receptor